MFDIPIYALSGYTSPEFVLKCRGSGIKKVFCKPIKLEMLKNLIDDERKPSSSPPFKWWQNE